MAETQRHTGTVKWFNATKGFGFITPDVGGEDLFVHQTSIQAEGFRSLKEGEAVEYELEGAEDGRTKAIKVTGPEGAVPQGAPRKTPAARGGYAAHPAMRGGRGGRGPAARGAYYDYSYDPYAYYSYYGGYAPRGRGFPAARGNVGCGGYGAGRGRGNFVGPPPGQPGESSGLQVVVHNLPWNCTWQQLKDAFKDLKVQRADVAFDSWGRSRGFGVVRFATKEEAEAACEKLNNTEIEGRTVTVRIDRYA